MESPEPAEEQYSNSGKNSGNKADENESPDGEENYWTKGDQNALAQEVAMHSQPSERLLNKFSFGKPTPVDIGDSASQPTTKMGMMTSLLKERPKIHCYT